MEVHSQIAFSKRVVGLRVEDDDESVLVLYSAYTVPVSAEKINRSRHFSLKMRTIQTLTIDLRGHGVHPKHYCLMKGLPSPLVEMNFF